MAVYGASDREGDWRAMVVCVHWWSLISGSYHAFGNNGSTYNDAINDGNTITFSGVTSHTKEQILDALATVTDHIPVVADYQIPAVMERIVGNIPATLQLNESFQLDVLVRNAADVVAAIGADELTYSLTSDWGNHINQTATALSAGNTHYVTLDTSTPGVKTGMITLTSSSQQVKNGIFQIPVEYEVLSEGGEPGPAIAAKWTFESTGSSITGVGASFGPLAPETGSGAARGQHSSALTAWSSPTGNGSIDSFSSTRWVVGDYYEFQVNTDGRTDIGLTLDHTSNNAGPRDFGVFYSITGVGEFIDTGLTYSVLANAAPNPTWDSTLYLEEHFYSFDLSDLTALDDQPTLFLRLVNLSNISADGGTVANTGSSRVDNVTVYYNFGLDDLPGDFNDDGLVDTADYVVWRKTNANDTDSYIEWRTHFGETDGNGAGATTTVPEPGVWLLMVVGICMLGIRRGTLAAWIRQQ